MNFIQKNPNDPRYTEFHDGEYEYWPLENPAKPKSISIPAAVITGLELLAAAVAAGLLAVALSILYVTSAPLSITENTALINASVYNNEDDHSIVYTLSTLVHPDRVLQDGIMEEDESTLYLKDLMPGTTYLLRYYNADQKEVGDFQFTTPGDPAVSEPPDAPGHDELPAAETEPPETTQAPDETMDATEDETVPEAPTEPSTDTTGPDGPIYYPPTPIPPPDPGTEPTDPGTEPTDPGTEPTDPSTEPTDPSTEPTDPEIIVTEPDMGEVSYVAPEYSGDEINAYFQFEEYHVFQNVPADGYSIRVTQGGTEITNYTAERSADGVLQVAFTGNPIPVGKATTSAVTLTVDGNTYTSTNTISPPSLESVEVTATKNTDGTHTFTIIANVATDGTEKMVLKATLYTALDDYEGTEILLSEESPYRYTATYTTHITPTADPEQADVLITGCWARVNPPVYYESDMNHCTYAP